jgi:hypothetical protein
VVQRVVERENRRLLATVLDLRGRERRGDLVDELTLLPEPAGEVEKLIGDCARIPRTLPVAL